MDRKNAPPEHARPKPAAKTTPPAARHGASPLQALIDRLGNRRALLHLKRLAGSSDDGSRTKAVPPELPISKAGDTLEREAEGNADRLVSDAAPVSTEVPRMDSGGQRVLDGGSPLAADSRAYFEPRMRMDLGGVRVHDDPDGHRTAESLRAAAFTVGSDIVFAEGRYAPRQPEGKRLLAHELAHVAQARTGLIQRQDEDEEREDSPRSAPPDPIPAEDAIAPSHRSFTPRVDDREPDLVIVPDDASRADIAARLLGDEARGGELEVVASSVAGEHEQAVRAREPAHLVADVRSLVEGALDRQLTADLAWTIARLSESGLDDGEQWAVTERTLRWSQRSNITSPGGDSYFDAFLDGLARVTLTQPHWYTLTLTSESHTGLEWLISETGDKAEQIHKMIALRSRRFTTTYVVRDRSPELAPGDVAGRFYWSGGSGAGSGLQLLIAEALVNESSLERAETAIRSSTWQGIRIVSPGADGRFHGYGIQTPALDLMVQGPGEGASGHYYWYQPGTIMIGAGEFRADFPAGGPEQQEQRRSILTNAIADADAGEPMAVMGLDFDVLSTASLDQRVSLTSLALTALLHQDESTVGRITAVLGSGSSPQVNLLMRVILSTPNADFPAYERTLSSRGLLGQLLAMWDRPELVLVGRAFTAKTLASIPVGVEAFAGMETLQVGQDADGVYHYGYGSAEATPSQTIARADWPATGAPRIGREPGMEGEAAGAISRSAIVFHLGTSSTSSPGLEFGTPTRAFLPTELVRVEVVGEHPQTMIVSALEAASILGRATMSTATRRFGQLVNINMVAMSATGLARAFGPALTRALAAESIGEGLAIMGAAAGTTAGRQALMGALLVGSMTVVDAYREELNQSEAGRAFLAVYDVGMAVLIAHDVYRLMSSGLLEGMASAGRSALRVLTGLARNGVADLTQLFEALKLTAQRALAEGVLVEAIGPDGARTLMPANELRLSQLFMMSRAEVAGRAVMTTLTAAGASTATAERILQRLEALAGEGEELGQAWSAVARKASSLAFGRYRGLPAGGRTRPRHSPGCPRRPRELPARLGARRRSGGLPRAGRAARGARRHQ